MRHAWAPLVVLLLLASASPAAERSPKDALQTFNDLIGPWRGTGTPEGTPAERQKGFWTESQTWEWQFKGTDAWLKLAVEKGKYFTAGELRYVPARDVFQLTLATPEKQSLVFEGPFADKKLTLDRTDDASKESQRIQITFLHSNRFLMNYLVKKDGRPDFAKVYQVGVTKTDVPFAGVGDARPECVVSGGLGTIAVMHNGKTWYVCCSGCRDAFKDDPEKYIKEFEAKKKMK